MKIRWTPGRQGFPGFSGRYIVDSVRGQMRVRKWPRKRGTPKSREVRIQNAWFTAANLIAKNCEPSQMAKAIAMTKGTGLYPRDLLLRCMAGGIIQPVTASGRVMQVMRKVVTPVSWQGFALNLNANWNIGIGVSGSPDWPLPIRDSLGFWSVASPKLITIPPGVDWMQINASGMCPVLFNGNLTCFIVRSDGKHMARNDNVGNSNHGVSCTTGPIPVVAGETFQAFYWFGGSGVLDGNQFLTTFSGIILEGG